MIISRNLQPLISWTTLPLQSHSKINAKDETGKISATSIILPLYAQNSGKPVARNTLVNISSQLPNYYLYRLSLGGLHLFYLTVVIRESAQSFCILFQFASSCGGSLCSHIRWSMNEFLSSNFTELELQYALARHSYWIPSANRSQRLVLARLCLSLTNFSARSSIFSFTACCW